VDSVDTLCEVKDTFSKSSLTGVDVSRNTNISVLFNVFHILFPQMELMFLNVAPKNRKI
jgi:predicted metal-dependent hydrolase